LPRRVLLGVMGFVLLAMAADLLRRRREEIRVRRMRPAEALVLGGAIGLLGGLVGLILGSLRLPALLRLGERLTTAVGTNVAVGFFVGAAGVVGHLPGGVDWRLLGVGAAASVPGALLGSRLTGRLPAEQLERAIAAVLVVAGAATLVQAFV